MSFTTPDLNALYSTSPLTDLKSRGYAVLSASAVCDHAAQTWSSLQALQSFWAELPPDAYLKDGGRYRQRRHASFEVTGQHVQLVPHRAHWQPLDYNALHGGMQRLFEPIEPGLLAQPAWSALLVWLGQLASALRGPQTWFSEAHQFRIDTRDGIGRPTPEGAHRDGVDLVAVFLVARHQIKGGETRVFDAHGTHGERFTLNEPWSVLLLDDARVIHETTPIQPLVQPAFRDTLVVTLRAAGFQDQTATNV